MTRQPSVKSTHNTKAPNWKNQLEWENDKERANEQLPLIFQLLNLYSGGHPVCPVCGNNKPKTVVFKTSKTSNKPYWKCYPCGENGSGLKLYLEKSGLSYTDAINTLLGRTTDKVGKKVDLASLPKVEPPFQAIVDVEVYNFIRESGSSKAAADYWMKVAHIPEEIVLESTSTMILDAKKVQIELLKKFGRERLIACGVLTVDKNSKDFFLAANKDYPVGEWHLSSLGHVVGAQFRPTLEVKKKIDAHKAWKKKWQNLGLSNPNKQWVEDWISKGSNASVAYEEAKKLNAKTAGSKIEYITPFLSLKGAGSDSLVGCGLHRLANLVNSNENKVNGKKKMVYIVEGFKDMLAARAMGAEAYAMPGVGNLPSFKACSVLENYHALVCLDGDSAGEKSRPVVLEYFKEKNIEASEKTDMPVGLDVADLYIQRNAHTGCACSLCVKWRDEHPEESVYTCLCSTCKKWRIEHKK